MPLGMTSVRKGRKQDGQREKLSGCIVVGITPQSYPQMKHGALAHKDCGWYLPQEGAWLKVKQHLWLRAILRASNPLHCCVSQPATMIICSVGTITRKISHIPQARIWTVNFVSDLWRFVHVNEATSICLFKRVFFFFLNPFSSRVSHISWSPLCRTGKILKYRRQLAPVGESSQRYQSHLSC